MPEQLGVFAIVISFVLGVLWFLAPVLAGFDHRFWGSLGIAPTEANTQTALSLGHLSEYKMLLTCEGTFVIVAILMTHWIYRKPVKHFKLRPY